MTSRFYAPAILFALMIQPADAQTKIPLPAGRVPTTAQVLTTPLSDLLQQGFVISSGMGGFSGGSYVLHNQDSGKWVACDMSPAQYGNPAASVCIGLN